MSYRWEVKSWDRVREKAEVEWGFIGGVIVSTSQKQEGSEMLPFLP